MKKLLTMYVKFNEVIIGNKKGAAMIEYALVLAAIVALATALYGSTGSGTFAGAIKTKLDSIRAIINPS
ncbi:MAG TPA: Flp family type IVb pilin [Desulfobacterales bacterium]|nr:Flp family type IVb pilin [Desulfobacterales bacterium]